jgi:hypothetical protein
MASAVNVSCPANDENNLTCDHMPPNAFDIGWEENPEYAEGKRPGTLCWSGRDPLGVLTEYRAVPRRGEFTFYEPQKDQDDPSGKTERTVIMCENGWTLTRIERPREVLRNWNEDEVYMASDISGDQGDSEMAELTTQLKEWYLVE